MYTNFSRHYLLAQSKRSETAKHQMLVPKTHLDRSSLKSLYEQMIHPQESHILRNLENSLSLSNTKFYLMESEVELYVSG